MKKRILASLLSAATLLSMVACGDHDHDHDHDHDQEVIETVDSVFPFTLTTQNDLEVTFTGVPETIIACNANAGDQLMAMGLGSKIIGTAYNNSRIYEGFRAEYEAIPVLAETYISVETILDMEPDFVYGRSSSFNESQNTTHDVLTRHGIMSLASLESYTVGCELEDVYQDFYNLGKIFDLEDRAEEIVSGIKAQIAAVDEAVTNVEPIKVFVYDAAREDGAYTCGNNFTSKLISYAGGENIYSDLDTTWATVAWEDIIDRAPEVIVINDYGSTSLETKIAELKENPALATIPAIANDRIISVTLCEVFASSMLGTTIEKFADAFHPSVYTYEAN